MSETHLPTRTIVHEKEDLDVSRNFYVTPDGQMLDGPGSLDGLLVIADAEDFGVRVETQRTTLVDDDFTKLSTWSEDLEHVSTRTTGDGDNVLSVTDFPFRGGIRVEVTVSSDLTVSWLRAVYTVGREVDY